MVKFILHTSYLILGWRYDMKRVIILLASAVAVMLVVLTLTGRLYSQQAQKPLIGVVDLLQISLRWKKWTRLNDIMGKEEKKFKERLEKYDEELQNLQQELKQDKPGSKNYEKTEIQFHTKGVEQKNYFRREGDKLKEKAKNYAAELVTNMEGIIAQYGRVNNYALIVKKQETSVDSLDFRQLQSYIATKSVMYYAKKINLTDAIIKELNDKHK
jgi:Skp family chaperone for outer membrane proteins